MKGLEGGGKIALGSLAGVPQKGQLALKPSPWGMAMPWQPSLPPFCGNFWA